MESVIKNSLVFSTINLLMLQFDNSIIKQYHLNVTDTKKNGLNKYSLLVLVLFLFFSGWFAGTYLPGPLHGKSTVLLSEVYGVVALIGGIYGLSVAKNWGYFKSYFGRAIILISCGLLLQEFGQLAYSYLNSIKHVELPYPSIPDIGFFGSIPMYILAARYLIKGLGIASIVKKNHVKLLVGVLIPEIILAVSYWFLLKGYSTEGKSSLAIFFDYGYPIGQAIYVSLALIILLSVSRLLGGLMRIPTLLLLLAYLIQYLSDFNFIFQTIHETWGPGMYGDYLYFTSYCLLFYSLIRLNSALNFSPSHKKDRDQGAD